MPPLTFYERLSRRADWKDKMGATAPDGFCVLFRGNLWTFSFAYPAVFAVKILGFEKKKKNNHRGHRGREGCRRNVHGLALI